MCQSQLRRPGSFTKIVRNSRTVLKAPKQPVLETDHAAGFFCSRSALERNGSVPGS